MAGGIVRRQKNTVLTVMVSTVFFVYGGVPSELRMDGLFFIARFLLKFLLDDCKSNQLPEHYTTKILHAMSIR